MPISPQKALSIHDVIFNALHGEYGEDGKAHEYLDTHALRYTGSKSASARLSWNKLTSKQFFDQYGLKIPRYSTLVIQADEAQELAHRIFNGFPMPLVIKPVQGGASYGVEIIHDFQTLVDSLTRRRGQHVILEEYIEGIPVSVGVVDGLRGKDIYSLVPVQIHSLKEYPAYGYKKEEFRYMPLLKTDLSVIDELRETAERAHRALGLRHYSRSDFIVSPKRGMYLLETNALPDVSADSPFMYSLDQSGITTREFLEHVILMGLGHV